MALGPASMVFGQVESGRGVQKQVERAGNPDQANQPVGTPKPPEAPAAAAAPDVPPDQASPADGPAYKITRFTLSYGQEVEGQPALSQPAFERLKITFGVIADGSFTAARPGQRTETYTLEEINGLGEKSYHGSAIQAICDAVVREINRRGIIGLFVAPADADIDPENGDDLREGRSGMQLVVWTGRVGEVRTVAGGDRGLPEPRIDNPLHARIRRDSPVKKDGLLRKDKMDDYLYRLNRQPGRHVDVAVSAGGQPGEVMLDYLVNENKPWSMYFQLSNTGTSETADWRERFGFVHNQLTNHDDVFRVDYVTANFSDTNGVVASYDVPIASDRLRFRAYGTYSDFTASDLGIDSSEQINGDSWSGGGELVGNVAQWGPAFLDLIGGARWEHVMVNNQFSQTRGADDFFLPYIGARFTRETETASTLAALSYQWSMSGVSGEEQGQLDNMGRVDPSLDFSILSFEASHSFYIEPQFKPTDPKNMTLAHELAFSVRGQYAFGDRLIPYYEQTVGGLYTVRGYRESAIAGDSVVVSTIEYRFHLPRSLSQSDRPGSFLGRDFRWRPQGPYGRTDWDLILRSFLDVGRAVNSDRISGLESDDTLVGAGLGAEIQFLRNFSFRVDWGVALKELDSPGTDPVSAGSNRLHMVLTLLF